MSTAYRSNQHPTDSGGKMLHLSKSWYYWAMAGLLIAQVVLSVNYHVLVCNMPIANTLLLLIIMAHHGYTLGEQARPLFHRICGCVAFIAVLFVNTTHALEMLSPSNSEDGHSHSHAQHNENDSGEHDHVGEFELIPVSFMYVSVFDVLLKCLVVVLGYVPVMGLPPVLRIILHTLSPATVIALYVLGLTVPTWVGESWLWKHVDPITAVAMTVLFMLLIYPAFKEMMPYIFVDRPEDFQEDVFKEEISKKFPGVSCNHIHAYRLWPGNLFEALIHINIKIDKSSADWCAVADKRFEEVRTNVERVLSKAGAQKVVVEPRFLDMHEAAEWVGCVKETCFQRDKGCCAADSSSGPSTP